MLTQNEAYVLLKMEKHALEEEKKYEFPLNGMSFHIPLVSNDKHEEFCLDVTRSYVAINKMSYNHRSRKVFILARIDLNPPPHTNPDGIEIKGDHIHLYKEGFNDKWAYPISEIIKSEENDPFLILQAFMDFCNISPKPTIKKNLFT